jgi:hypothetical protein
MNTIPFISAVQNREQLKIALKYSEYVVIPPELADLLVTADKQQAADKPKTADKQKATDKQKAADQPKTANKQTNPDTPYEKLIIAAPRVFADIQKLKKLRERGFDKLLCHTVDAIEIAAELDYKAFGGYGLNITNSRTAKVFGIPFIASIEAKSFDTKYMTGGEHPCAVYAYGRFPVMTTVQKFNSNCLTDRTNRRFKLKKSRNYTEILNANRLSLSGKQIIADYLFLDFYDETPDQITEIFKAFTAGVNIPAQDRENITRGLYI